MTSHAKKAAEEASKSVQEASKSALEASKTAAGVSKNTFDDLTYVGKSTFGDLTKSAKEAVVKKGLLRVCSEFPQLQPFLNIYFFKFRRTHFRNKAVKTTEEIQ